MGRWNVYEEYSSGAFMRILIRDIRRDEEGVASTVGTIMALLVFLTFLSLIVNQYVPVWMKDSEASHMNNALGQFGGLKGAIDLQILAAEAARTSGTHYIPVTASSAVTLGVDGVPIFSAPSIGALQAIPDAGSFTVQFSYIPNKAVPSQVATVNETSSGAIQLSVGNRYYIAQTIAYENGAVIRYQSDIHPDPPGRTHLHGDVPRDDHLHYLGPVQHGDPDLHVAPPTLESRRLATHHVPLAARPSPSGDRRHHAKRSILRETEMPKQRKVMMPRGAIQQKAEWSGTRGSYLTHIPNLTRDTLEEIEVTPIREPISYSRVVYDHDRSEYIHEVWEPQPNAEEREFLDMT